MAASIRTLWLRSLVLGAACLLASCAIFPVPGTLPDRDPFPEKKLDTIQPGVTSKAEVAEIFANWGYKGDMWKDPRNPALSTDSDADWQVYQLRREMWGWDLCFVVAAGFGGQGDCGEWIRDDRSYALLITFDADDVVREIHKTHEDADCAPGGACIRQGYVLLAGDTALPPHEHECAVHAYADEGETFADFFQSWVLPPGSHELCLGVPDSCPTVACEAGESRYFRIEGNTLVEVPVNEGRDVIATRLPLRRSFRLF